MKEFSLLNGNYEKVLNILGDEIKSSKQLKNNRSKVIKLTNCDELSNNIETCFSLIKDNLPKEFLEYNNYEELNILLRSYYKMAIDLDVKDHGYTLIVLYYLWVTRNE